MKRAVLAALMMIMLAAVVTPAAAAWGQARPVAAARAAPSAETTIESIENFTDREVAWIEERADEYYEDLSADPSVDEALTKLNRVKTVMADEAVWAEARIRELMDRYPENADVQDAGEDAMADVYDSAASESAAVEAAYAEFVSATTTTTTTTTIPTTTIPTGPTATVPTDPLPSSEVVPGSDTNAVLQSVPIVRGELVALTPASIRDENPYADVGNVERISLGPVEGIGISFRAAAEQLGSHWFLSLIVGLVAAAMSLTIVERRAERMSA